MDTIQTADRRSPHTRRRGRRLGSALLWPAALLLAVAGCDDDPAQPMVQGELSVSQTTVAFAEVDPVLGSVEMPVVTIMNSGDGSLTIDEVALEGAMPGAFSVTGADDVPFTLAPGATREVALAFAPTAEGSFAATVRVDSDGASGDPAQISLSGTASSFSYAQVDRMGIAALNTVFNHPTSVDGFDKTAYNVASPVNDVATYRGTFLVVLGAVGNADPEATADLLLPDELPIDMGVSATAFADLTGRTPADDATDVALTVTVGVPSLQSDNVDSNDKAFMSGFPYLATPH